MNSPAAAGITPSVSLDVSGPLVTPSSGSTEETAALVASAAELLDVLVVGGGPAGLATAILVALRGLRVAVVEPRSGPIDKACGEGLMPAALRRLQDLGVDPPGRDLRGIRYLDEGHQADALFGPEGSGRGVRRTTLQAALAARAAELGIPILPRRAAGYVREADGTFSAAGLRARYLVAADGLHSPLRRAAGLDPMPRQRGGEVSPGKSMPIRGLYEESAAGEAVGGVNRASGKTGTVERIGAGGVTGEGGRVGVTGAGGVGGASGVIKESGRVGVTGAGGVGGASGVIKESGRVGVIGAGGGTTATWAWEAPGAGIGGAARVGSGAPSGVATGESLSIEARGAGRPGAGGVSRASFGAGVRRARYGLRRHYRIAPWADVVEVHWTRDAEAYVTPVADDVVGVAILGPGVGARRAGGSGSGSGRNGGAVASGAGGGAAFDRLLVQFPALRERLVGAEAIGSDRGAGPLRQAVPRRVSADGVLLVGDASGYIDALTGEGIGVALAQARVLADCLAVGRPGDYERAWLRATRSSRWLTEGLLRARLSPLTGRGRVLVPVAQRLPFLFTAAVRRAARA